VPKRALDRFDLGTSMTDPTVKAILKIARAIYRELRDQNAE
jgi:hypothetical protein